MEINQENIESQVLRQQTGTRGGGVEIDLTEFGFEGEKMAAYQNYLGGGLLGRIVSNNTIQDVNNVRKELQYSSKEDLSKLAELSLLLKTYFHNLNNPEGEYDEIQRRPVAGY